MNEEELCEWAALDDFELSCQIETLDSPAWTMFWLDRRPSVAPYLGEEYVRDAKAAQCNNLEKMLTEMGYPVEQAAIFAGIPDFIYTVQ